MGEVSGKGRIEQETERYREMGWGDRPFAMDGLTVNQILTLYRDGENKREMVGILADLCGTDRRKMTRFLTARGVELPVKKSKEPVGEGIEREMARLSVEGITRAEAGRRLGLSDGEIRRLSKRYDIRFVTSAEKRAADTLRNIEIARKLAAEGKTTKQAAEIMGLSRDTVGDYAIKGGFYFARAKGWGARKG